MVGADYGSRCQVLSTNPAIFILSNKIAMRAKNKTTQRNPPMKNAERTYYPRLWWKFYHFMLIGYVWDFLILGKDRLLLSSVLFDENKEKASNLGFILYL